MRDFIHIDDCVQGVIKTMDKINDASAINLSTGVFTSFINFLNIGKKISGFDFNIKTKKSKPVGVYARAGSIKKQKLYNFKHEIKIEQGISRGLEYFEKLL